VARTSLGGEFRTSFVDRNRNFKNAPNMSFGSNGVDWVCSFRKTQRQLFPHQPCQNYPLGQVSHEFCRPRPRLQKCTKHEFWVKRGGLGAFISKKSTASFFAPQVARTALTGGFRMSFVDRNQNFENAPNMSFGSKGVNRVRSFRKNQLQVFSLHKRPEWPSGAGFARVLSTDTETAKTQQT
jgi:hypothetical protein